MGHYWSLETRSVEKKCFQAMLALLQVATFCFLSCITFLAVDQNIRLYDTRRGRFNLQRTVKARDVGWSVLDVCFTPDAHHVLYSSWSGYSKATRHSLFTVLLIKINVFVLAFSQSME